MDKKRMSWQELCRYMVAFNEKHKITCKGFGPKVTAVAVISEDSFDAAYTEVQRSYRFTNHNKAFIPSNLSRSIFADCLDDTEVGIRLDWYLGERWKVEYAYIESEDEETS